MMRKDGYQITNGLCTFCADKRIDPLATFKSFFHREIASRHDAIKPTSYSGYFN